MKTSTIVGVEIKQLTSYPDQRGFFREVFRANEPLFSDGVFGQWSHSKMTQDVVKAWHYHHVQTDWWYIPLGVVETVLYDNREESPTFKVKQSIMMGDDSLERYHAEALCVRIPPGVLHGCKVLSHDAHLFYVTSHTYDPNEEGNAEYTIPQLIDAPNYYVIGGISW